MNIVRIKKGEYVITVYTGQPIAYIEGMTYRIPESLLGFIQKKFPYVEGFSFKDNTSPIYDMV